VLKKSFWGDGRCAMWEMSPVEVAIFLSVIVIPCAHPTHAAGDAAATGVDQCVMVPFDFRRYAMKPNPTKPQIIIGHVECPRGTETAGAISRVIWPVIPCQLFTLITLISE